MADLDRDLIYALKAMQVILNTGMGVPSAIKHIAEEDYGEVSILFRGVLERCAQGQYLEIALKELMDSSSSEGIKKTAEALIRSQQGSQNVSQTLKEIANEMIAKRKIVIEEFSHTATRLGTYYFTATIFVPIMAFLFLVISMVMSNVSGTASMIIGGIPDLAPCSYITLVLSVLGGIILILWTKARSPQG
ncbi:MAG: type II secretion system F family protein [Thermoplasmata archaeon]